MTEPTITVEKKAFDSLCEELRKATNEYRKPCPDAYQLEDLEVPHPQREATASALVAVLGFLRPRLPDAFMLTPLSDVLAALADVDEGRMHPLFEPRTKLGGKRSYISDDADRDLATAAVTLMIEGGMKKRDALRRVASNMDMSQSQLDRWRKNIADRPPRIRELHQTFLSWVGEAVEWIANETGCNLEDVSKKDAARRTGLTLHSVLSIKQPEVWRFGFPVISHPGISI